MKNVLVTGGAGFIGSNFIHHLLRHNPDVRIVNLDALTYAGSEENLRDLPDPGRYLFIRGEICDLPSVSGLMRTHAIDTIVHFAAESHVDRSILAPMQFIQTNVMGTFSLLEAARHVWFEGDPPNPHEKRFHHISTDEVFGSLGAEDPAFCEETPYAPNSPYAASKAASDHIVRAYAHTYGLPVTITNCSNNYGPFQFPEKLIPLIILNAMEGQPLPVYGDGRQIRDWLYVDDHCEAIRQVLEKGRSGETYNVGGDNQSSNIDLVRMVCKILDEYLPSSAHCPHESLITFVADRPGHDRRYAMNIGKIRRDLGWTPQEGLQSGLRKTVRWYLDHLGWVKTIRDAGGYQQWLKDNYSGRGGNP
jgi:dTDP-glucose 4,6-dehydratase